VNASFLSSRPARFLAHAIEMCLVMCFAAIVLNVVFFEGAWLVGQADLRTTAPEVSFVFLTLSLAVPMFFWMRYRGHAWQPTIEMGGSVIALALVLVAAAAAGLVLSTEVFDIMTRLACPAMIAAMLVRYDLYASPMAHQHHAG